MAHYCVPYSFGMISCLSNRIYVWYVLINGSFVLFLSCLAFVYIYPAVIISSFDIFVVEVLKFEGVVLE